MENSVCLDTDVLADFLRNKSYAVDWFKKNREKNLATTTVNLFELFYGAYKSSSPSANLKSLDKIINNLSILSFAFDSSHEAGRQLAELEKKGDVIEFRDVFIGAIAISSGFSLKTNNKKHFERIEGLKLVD